MIWKMLLRTYIKASIQNIQTYQIRNHIHITRRKTCLLYVSNYVHPYALFGCVYSLRFYVIVNFFFNFSLVFIVRFQYLVSSYIHFGIFRDVALADDGFFCSSILATSASNQFCPFCFNYFHRYEREKVAFARKKETSIKPNINPWMFLVWSLKKSTAY